LSSQNSDIFIFFGAKSNVVVFKTSWLLKAWLFSELNADLQSVRATWN